MNFSRRLPWHWVDCHPIMTVNSNDYFPTTLQTHIMSCPTTAQPAPQFVPPTPHATSTELANGANGLSPLWLAAQSLLGGNARDTAQTWKRRRVLNTIFLKILALLSWRQARISLFWLWGPTHHGVRPNNLMLWLQTLPWALRFLLSPQPCKYTICGRHVETPKPSCCGKGFI